MKKVFKITLFLLIGAYFVLYISYRNGYIERKNHEKTILTDEMIMKYEEDLKNGVDVSKIDYIIEENNYSNFYTNMNLKIANRIEKGFDNVIKYIFRKINNIVEE